MKRALGPVTLMLATRLMAAQLVSFDALVKHPEAYHRKQITFVAVAIGNGPTLELRRDAKSADHLVEASEAILGRGVIPWDEKRRYHLRLVRVTGRVDAHDHGIWGNACEVSIERIDALSDEPVVPRKIPVAVIHNATSSPYGIRASAAGVEAKLWLAPKGILELPRPDGTLSVVDAHGSVVAQTKLDVGARSRYLDRKEGSFYYEIGGATITQVMPAVAKAWGWRR
jgi:hypothetical protein